MTARAPDGPGDQGTPPIVLGHGVLVIGPVSKADTVRVIDGPHDDITRVSFLMVDLSAADRQMVRALVERLAGR